MAVLVPSRTELTSAAARKGHGHDLEVFIGPHIIAVGGGKGLSPWENGFLPVEEVWLTEQSGWCGVG